MPKMMTRYQAYMEQHDKAIALAKAAFDAGDFDMCMFWKNAAEGFKNKALNLMVGE